MNKKNETLKETFLAALEHYKKKDYKTVEIYCYKILNIDPNHVSSISMLATISAVNRNFVKAKELLNKAIKIEPNNINVIQNLGTTYKELGQYTEAIKYYKKVLEINPNHTNAHYSLGLVFYLLNDLKKAKSYLIKTIGIQKNYGLAFFVLANIHVDLKEYNEAVSCYQKAIELNPNLVGAHNNLGLVFRTLNDFESAINCYQKAITIKNNNAGAHHNLALTFKDIGRFEEAIKSHEMAIKYEPDNLAHYHFLTELKKDILNSNLKKKIEKILSDKKCTNSNNAYGNYLLSKYEKKEKNYEKEFNFLIKGHKNFFSTREKKFELGVKYCFDDVLQISKDLEIDQIDKKKYDEMKPIFIVGVPRCGSTLVEKIIGSGKQSISIGEETAILENFINKKILEKQSLNLGQDMDLRKEIYNIYHEKGLISKKNNNIVTDKSLNNFFYLKLINIVYPNAIIINCKRDPISSIVSIFQNNLTELAWTHDLNNIFKYFDNYFKIIEEYNLAHPDTMYHLQLENLVQNPEIESKKLMDFCNLTWDKNCLEFHKRKDLFSKTASNIQIRKAIYRHQPEKNLPYKKILDKYGKKYSWFK